MLEGTHTSIGGGVWGTRTAWVESCMEASSKASRVGEKEPVKADTSDVKP